MRMAIDGGEDGNDKEMDYNMDKLENARLEFGSSTVFFMHT